MDDTSFCRMVQHRKKRNKDFNYSYEEIADARTKTLEQNGDSLTHNSSPLAAHLTLPPSAAHAAHITAQLTDNKGLRFIPSQPPIAILGEGKQPDVYHATRQISVNHFLDAPYVRRKKALAYTYGGQTKLSRGDRKNKRSAVPHQSSRSLSSRMLLAAAETGVDTIFHDRRPLHLVSVDLSPVHKYSERRYQRPWSKSSPSVALTSSTPMMPTHVDRLSARPKSPRRVSAWADDLRGWEADDPVSQDTTVMRGPHPVVRPSFNTDGALASEQCVRKQPRGSASRYRSRRGHALTDELSPDENWVGGTRIPIKFVPIS